MIGRTVRGALVAVALLAIPVAPARACHLFDRCCGKPTTTFYTPYVANYAPSCCPAPQPQPCCQQQVVNYMPQTCYRTVYVNTPVMAYRPMSACGPCGRTTVMRPVTTYVARPQLVPYTAYRPVVSQMPISQPCCGTTVPATMVAPAISSGPACCSAASATTAMPVPTTLTPAPTSQSVPYNTPGATLQGVTPAPSLNTVPPAQSNQTFEPSPSDYNAPQSRVLMPPSSTSNLSNGPRGLDPQPQDRTTAIPLRPSFAVRQASLVTSAKAEPPKVDDGGWRAGK